MNHPLTSRALAIAGLALCLAALAAGADALPAPPTRPHELTAWWSSSDPALALGALLRLAAAVTCAWLLLVTLLDSAATIWGWKGATAILRHAVPRAWQVLVLRPLAVGTLAVPALLPVANVAPAVAQSTVTVPSDLESADDGPPVVLTMTLRDDAPNAVDTPAPSSTTSPPGPTTTSALTSPTTVDAVEVLPEDTHDHTDDSTGVGLLEPPPHPDPTPAAPTPDDVAASPTDPSLYLVVAGDSFWRIAAVHVEAHIGRVPEPHEIATYWRTLLAANDDRLAVPGNPDLIFPGDELVLPPI